MDGSSAGEVSTAALLTAAAHAGHDVRESTLKRWHRQGVIPRPRTVALGRGLGTASLYPAGTTAQLLDALRLHRPGCRIDRLRWQLWWRGYDVDLTLIRGYLRRLLAPADRQLQVWKASDEDERDRLVRETLQHPRALGSRARRAHRRLGDSLSSTHITLLAQIGAGEFDGWRPQQENEEDDADILVRGSGLAGLLNPRGETPPLVPVDNLKDSLKHLSTIFEESGLCGAVEDASDEDLAWARRALIAVLPILAAVGQAARSIGEDAYGLVALADLAVPGDDEQPVWVLLLSLLRRPLRLDEGIAEFLSQIGRDLPQLAQLQAAGSDPGAMP